MKCGCGVIQISSGNNVATFNQVGEVNKSKNKILREYKRLLRRSCCLLVRAEACRCLKVSCLQIPPRSPVHGLVPLKFSLSFSVACKASRCDAERINFSSNVLLQMRQCSFKSAVHKQSDAFTHEKVASKSRLCTPQVVPEAAREPHFRL